MWRADLEAINAFDETMLNGWIVDSNIARRLFLLRGETHSLADRLVGYHCAHTRQPTALAHHGHV